MEVVKAFVTLKPGFRRATTWNSDHEHRPEEAVAARDAQAIEFVQSLPKTRSGKIVRRVFAARGVGRTGR